MIADTHDSSLSAQALRQALTATESKRRALACFWFSIGNPTLLEIALDAAPELMVIDRQHGLWERATLEAALGVARHRVPVIVRCADHTAHAISEALDAGAAGVLVPLIETAEQACMAVAHGRYPPEGVRSAGGIRPLLAGLDAMLEANRHIAIGVMIETVAGVEQVEAIAAVPGLDYLFIGTGDLSLSLGIGPDSAAALERACARVHAAARANGVTCGIFTSSVEDALKRRAEGYQMVVAGNDIDIVRQGVAAAQRAWCGNRT